MSRSFKKDYPAKRKKKPLVNRDDEFPAEEEKPEEEPEFPPKKADEQAPPEEGQMPPEEGAEEQPAPGEEQEPQVDEMGQPIEQPQEEQGEPSVGKTFRLLPKVVAVPIHPKGTADSNSHDPKQSPLFTSISDHAQQSLSKEHHEGLKTFHKTAKDMIEQNHDDSTKKSIIKKIIEKWLGGKK